jgi:uncharacterized protein (UPF0305 family)
VIHYRRQLIKRHFRAFNAHVNEIRWKEMQEEQMISLTAERYLNFKLQRKAFSVLQENFADALRLR